MKRFLPLFVVCVMTVLLATAVQAAEPRSVIIFVDPASGVALLPEGEPIPQGITVYDSGHKPLAFANASGADERLAAAKARVEETTALRAGFPAFMTRETPDLLLPKERTRPGRLRPDSVVSDTTYYVNFVDGSYISAWRLVEYFPGYPAAYAWGYSVRTSAYTPENDYYNGSIYVEQSSADHSGFNVSAYCTINYAGGYCSTPTYGYQADANFTSHVTSYGNIHHHRLPICGRYGEPPCNENLNGSIDIYFP